MPKIYRGIDIAGDQGQTGFVDLVEEDDGQLWAKCVNADLTGWEGLKTLMQVDAGDHLVAAAIDQPLGFPAQTLRLLAWPEKLSELPAYDATRGRFREADIEMREDLKELNRDYVRPPVVCDNIWRAVYLIRAADGDVRLARNGGLPWFETHPRLCVLGLLRHTGAAMSYLADYKVKALSAHKTYSSCRPLLKAMKKKRLLPSCLNRVLCEAFHRVLRDRTQLDALSQEASSFAATANDEEVTKHYTAYQAAVEKVGKTLDARRYCIELLTSIVPIVLSDYVRMRFLDVSTSDPFEALFCAIAAYAKAKGATRQYPQCPHEPDIEGVVLVPDYSKLEKSTCSDA